MRDLVPVLDWDDYEGSDAARPPFIRAFGQAMQNIGFVRLLGAPVSHRLIADLYASAREFFNLPLEERMHTHFPQFSGQRGYMPLGYERYEGKEPELKEWFGFGRYVGAHPMFEETLPAPDGYFPPEMPEFQRRALALYDQLDGLGIEQMKIIFMYLDLDPDIITRLFASADSQMRVLMYRDPAALGLKSRFRSHGHLDESAITNMPAPTRRGLRLRLPGGKMVFAAFDQGEVVSNSGKLLGHLTGGLFQPRWHDVIAIRDEPGDRLSAPCFTEPDPFAVIEVPKDLHSRIDGPVPPPRAWADLLAESLAEHGVHKTQT